jgi:hypothetical protein
MKIGMVSQYLDTVTKGIHEKGRLVGLQQAATTNGILSDEYCKKMELKDITNIL